MDVEFDSSLKLGIKIIDDQHKELIGIINKLINEINHLTPQTNIEPIFQDLFNYTNYHFKTEEDYFKKFKYDTVETEHHIKLHRGFVEKINQTYKRIKSNNLKAPFELVDILEDWFIEHISVVDRKYVDCFHAHGLV